VFEKLSTEQRKSIWESVVEDALRVNFLNTKTIPRVPQAVNAIKLRSIPVANGKLQPSSWRRACLPDFNNISSSSKG